MYESNRGIIQAVVRSCTILEILADSSKGLGVSEISRCIGLGKAITYNTVQTLVSCGFIEQDSVTCVYQLGAKALKLSGIVAGYMDLRREAAPLLERLRDNTGESVFLAVLRSSKIVYIDCCDSLYQLKTHAHVGETAPLHCTALGKAICAFLQPSKLAIIVTPDSLTEFAPNTITTFTAFRNELDIIRQRGYSIDNSEHEDGVRCVAAPVLNRYGDAYAAVSISGPVFRMNQEKDEIFGKQVLEVARHLSERVM